MNSRLALARSWQLPAAAVFATMTSAIGLSRLIHTGGWVGALLLISLVIAGIGVLLRGLNAARPLVVLGQAVVLVLLLTVLFAHDAAIGGIIPGPGAFREISDRLSTAGAQLGQFSPPTPDTPDITALLAVCGAGFAFLIDIIAVTCRKPVLAGAPILAVYLIPATRQPGGYSWLAFACAAAGYLVLVGTDGHERLSQWGRSVQQRNGRTALTGSAGSGLTRQISMWSILVALVLPLLIPVAPQIFHFSGGSGDGGSGGTIHLNQSVDIAQDLATPKAIPLFQYDTDSQTPLREYFPQEVLTQFNGTQWDPPSSAVPEQSGDVSVPGLTNSAVARSTVHVQVNVNGKFSFSSAPSPYATTGVTGLRDVQIDRDTLTVYINDGDDGARTGTEYSTVSTQTTPTAAQLQAATVGQDSIGKNYLTLPKDVTSLLKTDAQRITAGSTTPYQQAVALQDYFLANFKYSLTPKISGNGVSAIESFLQNKQGFCQQFAATMAAMARALGIPAVVAIGYTPGDEQSDGSYQVTTHDAHAWPLLYFDGVGWVQFEPTPSIVSGGRADVQPWTVVQAQPTAGASSGVTAPESTAPESTQSASKCASGTSPNLRHVAEDGQVGDCGSQNSGAGATPTAPFASWGVFGVIPRWFDSWFLSGSIAQVAGKLLLLLLLVLSTLPGAAGLRRRWKRRRLLRKAAANGGPKPKLPSQRGRSATGEMRAEEGEGAGLTSAQFTAASEARRELAFTAWEELREYARDLGYGWPDSDTPRQLAGRLTSEAEFDSESAAAVGRVTTLVERAVYAPDPHIEPDEARALPGDVSRVRGALGVAAGRAARLRAAVLPSSSLDQLRLPWHRKRH